MTTTPVDRIDFGAGRLFVSDTRLALGALNYARYETLRRVFGVSREEANLLTFVLALGGTDAATRRAAGSPRDAHAVCGRSASAATAPRAALSARRHRHRSR